jgi:hypothetical protein
MPSVSASTATAVCTPAPTDERTAADTRVVVPFVAAPFDALELFAPVEDEMMRAVAVEVDVDGGVGFGVLVDEGVVEPPAVEEAAEEGPAVAPVDDAAAAPVDDVAAAPVEDALFVGAPKDA